MYSYRQQVSLVPSNFCRNCDYILSVLLACASLLLLSLALGLPIVTDIKVAIGPILSHVMQLQLDDPISGR